MARSPANEAFDALWSGPTAILSKAEARLEVAHWLGRHPVRLRPTEEREDALAWAVEAVRSYHEMRHLIEVGEPSAVEANVAEARELMAPKRQPKPNSTKPKITANRLWRKTSY